MVLRPRPDTSEATVENAEIAHQLDVELLRSHRNLLRGC
jgi:hypothetical protein